MARWWLGMLAVMATVLVGLPLSPAMTAVATTAPAFAATASLKQEPRFIGDARGSSYTFTVTNTGASARIGAVEIDRPVGWKVIRCPRPAGWKSSLSARGTCRFRSPAGALGDVRPGQSITLKVVARTAPGRQDRTGTWSVVVSKTHELGKSTGLKEAQPGAAGLTATLHTFEVTSIAATDGPAAPGASCPSAADVRAGQTSTIVVCGRNRSTVTLRPVLSVSALGGSFVHDPGTFSSDAIAPGAEVVLARWSGAQVAREPATSHDVTATVGSSLERTSQEQRLTDLVVTGHVPAPVDDAFEVLEDGALTAGAGDGLLANDQDADGDTLQVTGNEQPTHGELVVADDGSFTYEPDGDRHGPVTFDYVVSDGAATSTATASIDVAPVNDAPSFTEGADQTVSEDAGATTVDGWASDVTPGPLEAGQSVDFVVTNDNNGLFSAQPEISPAGALTFTPAPDAHGVATVTVRIKDDGGTAAGGVDASAPQTFTIDVDPVNDAPSFVKGSDILLLEDAGAQVVVWWATSLSAGPANEAGQTVSFTATNDDNGLFSQQPSLDPDGTLRFTAAPNAHGSATVSVALQDDGGTARGGDDTSDTQTFTITVGPVNDPPSATHGGVTTFREDAGALIIPQLVSADPGPREAGQTVAVDVTDVSPASLFSAGPLVQNDGSLAVTPAADANGSAVVTIRPRDDGGTADGGDDTGDTSSFTIEVYAVNDAPSFTKGADQTVLEDAGAQSVSNWATAVSRGPANEAAQSVDFVVTNDNNALFSAQPAVSPTGTLTFTAAFNGHGTATVTVVAHDDGGTANGGDDTSDAQTFTITVNGVNDAPVASPKNYFVHTNMRISLGGLLTGATDPDDTSFTVESVTPGAGCIGCTVSNVSANGTFDFDPPAGGTGTFQISYRIRDDGGPGPGEVSAPQTITLNVSGPVIWFVDPTATVGGSGRLSDPFDNLASANNAIARSSNHRVFVMSGDVAGDLTLRQGGWLVSDALAGGSFDAVMGVTPPAGTIARPQVGRPQRRVNGTITLGSNSVLRGVDITPPSGSPGLVGDGASAVLVEQVSVSTVGARAVDLKDTWGTMVLTRVSASGADRGVSLVRTNESAGFFFVTGAGSPGTGGTVTGSTAPGSAAAPEGGVYLDRARNVTLRWLEVADNDANGVYAVNSPDLVVTNPTIANNALHGLAVLADGSQRVAVTAVGGDYVSNVEGGVDLESNGPAGLSFDVSDGTIQGCGACGAAISVSKGTGATGSGGDATSGTIAAMTITNDETSGAPGIRLRGEGNGAVRLVVTDNVIGQLGNHGVDAAFGGTGGTTTTDLIVAGNVIDLDGAGTAEGIHVEAGVIAGTPTDMCADVLSNEIANAPGAGITVADHSSSGFLLPGYAGAPFDLAAVEQFLLDQNVTSTAQASVAWGGGGFVGDGGCTAP